MPLFLSEGASIMLQCLLLPPTCCSIIYDIQIIDLKLYYADRQTKTRGEHII